MRILDRLLVIVHLVLHGHFDQHEHIILGLGLAGDLHLLEAHRHRGGGELAEARNLQTQAEAKVATRAEVASAIVMCGAWIALWAGAWMWWRTTTFRPGCAILVNFPNCSINVTVPVFTWLGFKSGVVSADGRAGV